MSLLYYEALVGSNALKPQGVIRSVSLTQAHGDYANQVRKKLAETSDAALLAMVGSSLMQSGRELYRRGAIDFDPVALGQSYIERSLQLDPNQAIARRFRLRERMIQERSFHLRSGQSLEEEYREVSALPELERFLQLDYRAEHAYIRGEMDDYYKHDATAAKAGFDFASRFARDSLQLAPKFRNDPHYGAAIYRSNMVLGMAAMRAGDQKAAVEYMLDASRAPASEEVSYSHQYLSFKLPGILLKYGERESVIEFLENFARINAGERQYLLDSAALIRNGKKPLWYANW